MPVPSRPVRLLLLDCDGVLIRSEEANLAYYNALFQAFGLPEVSRSDRATFSKLHTLSTPQVIDAFFPTALQESAREFALGLEYEPFARLVEPEPGWRDVIRWWRSFGPVAVATNRGVSARSVLRAVGLLDLLDLVVGIRDVARPKPHPDLLFRALDHFGVSAEDALYVGDAEIDREAARRASVRFLGFRLPEPPSVASAAEAGDVLARLADPASTDTLVPATL